MVTKPQMFSPPRAPQKKAALSLLFGGLLPLVAFTVVEDRYGPLWGTLVAMAFGAVEIIWEKTSQGRVSAITWGGNALVVGLGLVSIVTQEGIWFKLQPALMEAVIALLLFGTWLAKKPLLLYLAQKQGAAIPESLRAFFSALSLRLGIFFALHAALATWAAFAWSTKNWLFLKGIGFTLSFLAYMGLEIWWMRRKNRRS